MSNPAAATGPETPASPAPGSSPDAGGPEHDPARSERDSDRGTQLVRPPFWLRPMVGPEPMPRAALRTLILISVGMYFENYDVALLNAALPQVAAELQIGSQESAYLLALIRLGGIGTFLLVPFADRFGRRRAFLLAMIGMSIGVLLSGLAQTALQFMLAQLASRAFMLLGAALSVVILVEEFPAERRGAGLGALSMLGGLGYGLGAILYGFVDVLPFGWRALYAFGVVPLLLLPFFRSSLRETTRFREAMAARSNQAAGSLREWLAPIVNLMLRDPRRAAAVGFAGLMSAMGGISLYQYASYFVQNAHGWAPAAYSGLVIGGGVIGVLGNVVGGRGSDRWGRRKIGAIGLVMAPIFAALFYNGPSWVLPLAFGLFIFSQSMGDLIVRAISAELFPTSHRGTSSGWLVFVQSIGWFVGLALVGIGTTDGTDVGALALASTWVGFASMVAALCLLAVPESGAQELESLEDAQRAH